MFFIQYEVAPAADSEYFSVVGGAFANCFIVAESSEKAQEAALQNFKDNGWVVVAVEEEPRSVLRQDYMDEPDWLECYDQATSDGECYVFHQWPPEAQEDDEVH